MGIVSINTDLPGQIGVRPRRVKIVSTDNLATVTTAGYLNGATLEGYTIYNTDVIDMWYGATIGANLTIVTPGTFESFTPSFSNGVITLVAYANPGDVLLPVVSGDVAIFNGTTGQIKDSAVAFSNATDTVASLFHGTATAGDFVTVNNANKTIQDSGAAPSASSQAFVVMSPGSLTSGDVPSFSDANGTLADSGLAALNVTRTKVFTLTFTQLASAGKVNIQVHNSGTSQYFIQDVKVLNSTGLSGGGGNRLLAITDGTIVFNNAGITAALLGTPIFTIWGGTGNPISNGSSEVSTAGADIYFQYTGGTTDYTAGSVQIAVTYVKVTA